MYTNSLNAYNFINLDYELTLTSDDDATFHNKQGNKQAIKNKTGAFSLNYFC